MQYKKDEKLVIDMHVHTTYSDGVCSVEEILVYAKIKGLNGIAITDHDTVKGALKALKLSKNHGLLVIPGIEVSTSKAHVLLYGIEEDLPRNLKKKPDPLEIVDYAYENNLVVSIAHPYGKALFFKYPVAAMKEVLSKVHAIEVVNGRTPYRQNIKALELAKRYNKAYTAGSDAHIVDELGKITVMINEPVESYEEVLELVLRRKIKIIGSTRVIDILLGMVKRRVILVKRFLGR